MAVKEILKLGNPELYEKSEQVWPDELDYIARVTDDLRDTLLDFRERHGFGLAIAAPQIGVKKRLVYAHIGTDLILVNPVLKDMSEEMIELWDNCMSFPELLVKVHRHKKGQIDYRDLNWSEQNLVLGGDLSQLFQHECDHLDGILAVQRAVDDKSFALKSERAKLDQS
jgi:peptide deformylase